MANYVSIETQYTPLDVDGLQNELKNRRFFHRFTQRSTIFLIMGILAFMGSLGYSLTREQVTTTTRADVKEKPLPISAVPLVINPVAKTLKEYPQTYKETSIPKSLYTDVESNYAVDTTGRKNYIIDKIVRFYIYQDVLNEAGLSYEESEEEGEFVNLENDVLTMEKIITTELIGEGATYDSVESLVTEHLKYFQ